MEENFHDAREGVHRDRRIIPVALLLKPFCRQFSPHWFRTVREQTLPRQRTIPQANVSKRPACNRRRGVPYNEYSPMAEADLNSGTNGNPATETIVAISTPPGRGGIGIVRLSGPQSVTIAEQLVNLHHPLEHTRARLADVLDWPDHDSSDSGAQRIDEAVVTFCSAQVLHLRRSGRSRRARLADRPRSLAAARP